MNAVLALGVALVATTSLHAGSAVLNAAKDATLVDSPTGSLANGAGSHFYVGRTGQFENYRRRSLIEFNVAGIVPDGAVVDGVSLTLHVNRTQAGPEVISVHRVLRDWREGPSTGGGPGGAQGGPAQPSDVTWLHTGLSGDTWSNAGGDFVFAQSSSRSVGGQNADYTWVGPGLVADVQAWVDDPSQNFGWLLLGNEGTPQTAKRFSSRTNGDTDERPRLVVTWSFPPDCPGDTDGDGDVDVDDLNAVILDWGTDGSANGGDVTGPAPGSPPDGIVDVNDLNAVIVNWGNCG